MGRLRSVARARSSAIGPESSPDRIARVLEGLAAPEETGSSDIDASIALLRRARWLDDDGTADPDLTAARLARVGAANLPVGRLWEGHVNALHLARVLGDPRIAEEIEALVENGALLGVWGADGAMPVVPSPDGKTLTGSKKFASGLGTVTHSAVTVSSGPDVRLGLVDVRDPARADASSWRMRGMRATASGTFDLEGVAMDDILWLGGPGDYLKEPHFVGGVWRIAALQIGGALGLMEATAAELRARGRIDAPAQMSRLAEVSIRALGASALVTRAARAAAPRAPQSPEEAATLSAAARLLTEETALDAIRAAEQCLGLAHFEDGSVTGRKARDLAVYLRQAARDAFQTRVGEAFLKEEGGPWTLL